MNDFLMERMLRKQELQAGKISRKEYEEWKRNWTQTYDDCGKFDPKKYGKYHIKIKDLGRTQNDSEDKHSKIQKIN